MGADARGFQPDKGQCAAGSFEQEIAEDAENALSAALVICNRSETTANSRQRTRMDLMIGRKERKTTKKRVVRRGL
jgi:hypothetical protein